MIINRDEYTRRVLGCWLGKNAGGTLGAPFEWQRQVNNVTFYRQDLGGEPAPNDDLDLQLLWLIALEEQGIELNAATLAEYWLLYITPHWSEYGTSKANMRAGLIPPLCGSANNVQKDSCGSFIRSEIWACIAPGYPALAARFAYNDAIVDHGDGEGVYGEMFCAALESAAFVERDLQRLLRIGLSYIPADCGVAQAVQHVVQAHAAGRSWRETRDSLLTGFRGSCKFGVIAPEDEKRGFRTGRAGWDAPANVAIAVLGLLYGGDDFASVLTTAVNCGEDTDCTAGTLGSILGIIGGVESIPERWVEPLGRSIQTLCIDLADYGFTIPKTVDQLTERVMRLAPAWLGPQVCDVLAPGGYTIEMLEGDALLAHPERKGVFVKRGFDEQLACQPFSVVRDYHLFQAIMDYGGEPYIQEGIPRTFRLTFDNRLTRQQWLRLAWHLPAGWEVSPAAVLACPLETYGATTGRSMVEFTITPHNLTEERYNLVLEIGSQGHVDLALFPVVLVTGAPLS